MKSSSLARLSGLATALGGLLFVGFGLVFFVFTHGTTSTDRRGTLFGLDGTDYCRMQVAWPALLLVGLAAVHAGYGDRLARRGRSGLAVAALALVMQIAGLVMQCWLRDPQVASDFESVTLTLGFYLGALSYLVLAVGMVLFGVDALRRRALGWASPVPLVLGLLVMPTVLFESSGLSTGTRTWELIYTVSRLPLGLCWVLLGSLLWTASSPRTAWLADGHQAAPSRS